MPVDELLSGSEIGGGSGGTLGSRKSAERSRRSVVRVQYRIGERRGWPGACEQGVAADDFPQENGSAAVAEVRAFAHHVSQCQIDCQGFLEYDRGALRRYPQCASGEFEIEMHDDIRIDIRRRGPDRRGGRGRTQCSQVGGRGRADSVLDSGERPSIGKSARGGSAYRCRQRCGSRVAFQERSRRVDRRGQGRRGPCRYRDVLRFLVFAHRRYRRYPVLRVDAGVLRGVDHRKACGSFRQGSPVRAVHVECAYVLFDLVERLEQPSRALPGKSLAACGEACRSGGFHHQRFVYRPCEPVYPHRLLGCVGGDGRAERTGDHSSGKGLAFVPSRFRRAKLPSHRLVGEHRQRRDRAGSCRRH